MLSVRLPVNSKLSVKFGRNRKLLACFWLRGCTYPPCCSGVKGTAQRPHGPFSGPPDCPTLKDISNTWTPKLRASSVTSELWDRDGIPRQPAALPGLQIKALHSGNPRSLHVSPRKWHPAWETATQISSWPHVSFNLLLQGESLFYRCFFPSALTKACNAAFRSFGRPRDW